MTLPMLKLQELKGATSHDVEDFFTKNPRLHPNNLVAVKCHNATQALLETGAINGHTKYRGFAPALFTALYEKDCKEPLQLYLNHLETDPNCQDSDGKTPLHLAVSLKNYDAIRALISSDRVDPNIKDTNGDTALHLAALYGDLKAVELLLSNKNKKLELSLNKAASTAIDYAIYPNQNSEVYNRLRDYREYITTIQSLKNSQVPKQTYFHLTPLHEAVLNNDAQITPLHEAVLNNDAQTVEELLKKGEKLEKNIYSHTPLDYAIADGNEQIARLFSDHIFSSKKEVSQRVNECRKLVLYRNPTHAPTAQAANWARLNALIEKLFSSGYTLPSATKAKTLTLPSFPLAKVAPLPITGAELAISDAGSSDAGSPELDLPNSRACRELNLGDEGAGLPTNQLQVAVDKSPGAVELYKRAVDTTRALALYVPKADEVKAGIQKGAKKAAWFTCSTALYALAIIPALAIATKLYFVAQGYFGTDDLHEECLAASLDTRSFYNVWSPAPQSYVDCMGAGL